jgi:NhaP-type Na+/H+ and K+/H+ antiporter
MLLVRGTQLIAPKVNTAIRAGDYVSVFCRPEDRERMQQLFDAASTDGSPPSHPPPVARRRD